MEGLASTHILVLEILQGLERNDSLLFMLKGVASKLDLEMNLDINKIISNYEKKGNFSELNFNSKNIYRDAAYQTIIVGLKGEPIVKRLEDLLLEIEDACEAQVEEFMATLPIKVMLPVLLFQFPAFLLLIIGPILKQLIQEVS